MGTELPPNAADPGGYTCRRFPRSIPARPDHVLERRPIGKLDGRLSPDAGQVLWFLARFEPDRLQRGHRAAERWVWLAMAVETVLVRQTVRSAVASFARDRRVVLSA